MSLRKYILKENDNQLHLGKKINYLGIDVETYIVKEVVRRLQSLRTTVDLNNLGAYRNSPDDTKLHIATTMTEEQLDDWFYKTKFTDNSFNATVYPIKQEDFH